MNPFKRRFYSSIVRFQEIEGLPLDEAITVTFRLMKNEPDIKYLSTHQIGIELNSPRMLKYREKIRKNKIKFSK